ncbi:MULTISPECIES: hypothetical protein [Micromonospora]|uniref:hypothetical protein n=1 Tax=Micromonospora TaxID=1873 RepID=UPI0011CDCC07|nr:MULTISPECIES: hypothetical protein [Micromonospora]NES12867.1 hypothetical protein [Micromonospora sp. PPF5-17B]NES34815.1 hypothetical protein [Micromonospora solifontis]NES54792.1 hypothetical protein [Micromonospora sp. PPF5-6]
MAWPPKLPWRTNPLAALVVGVLVGWILLAVLMSGASLDRADKAASVVGMLVGLGALVVTLMEMARRRSPGDAAEPAHPQPALLKRPSVLAAAATVGVGLLVVILVGLAGGGEPEAGGPTPGPTASAPDSPTPGAVPESTGTASALLERCASPAVAGASPTVSATTEMVRHDGLLILSRGYYADLDSLCPDWDVAELLGSTGGDIGNDGEGLVRNPTAGVQIAAVQKDAPATFAMCAANTDYISETLAYQALAVGDRYCVLTDDGRRSLLTVRRKLRDGDRVSLQVQVRTWVEKRDVEKTDYVPWIVGGIILLVLLGGGATKAASGDGTSAD